MAPPVYRALIVDDDEDARALLRRALSKGALAFEITAACDGAEALALVATVHPDVVITDVMMPKLDGFTLCARLRADPATASLPIVIVTALEEDENRARGLGAGADAYFTKPFNWQELAACLKSLLGAGPS